MDDLLARVYVLLSPGAATYSKGYEGLVDENADGAGFVDDLAEGVVTHLADAAAGAAGGTRPLRRNRGATRPVIE